MKALAIIAAALLLSACGEAVPRPATLSAQPLPRPMPGALDHVMGLNAAGLTRLFGQPDADVREGSARRLQFESGVCVLDAYLYPPKNGGEQAVTYLDARQPDGSPIDRASCVAALSRRRGGK